MAALVRQQPEDAAPERRLAAARLADQAERLAAARSRSETPSTARTGSPLGAVPDPQVAHVEDRRLAHSTVTSRASPLVAPAGVGGPPPAELDLAPRDLRRVDAALADQRVEDVVEALADQGQAGHQEHDREAREQPGPPDARAGVVDRPLQVVAPLGRLGGLDAVAEEAERRRGSGSRRRRSGSRSPARSGSR